nr:radical SAM protein [Candidatus Baldrarchaeota archaeon]
MNTLKEVLKPFAWYAKMIELAMTIRLKKLFGKVYKPRWVIFQTTNKCNLLCLMCNVGREFLKNPQIASNDLTIEELKNIFKRDYNMLKNISFLELTGGEPFMRSDLVEMIKLFHNFLPKCYIWIPTNGTLPSKIEKDMSKIVKIHKNIGIGISLDGGEEVHDKLRGVKGTYKKAVQTIKAMVKLRKKHPWLDVMVSFTLTPLNASEPPIVYKLCKHLGVRFTIRPMHLSPIFYKNIEIRNIANEKNFDEATFNRLKKVFKTLVQEIIANDKLAAFPHLYYLENAIKFMSGDMHRNWECFAGTSAFYLEADGDVYPCTFLNKKLGNLRQTSLRDIWISKEAREARNEIAKHKCSCWVEHEAYRIIEEDFIRMLMFSVKSFAKMMIHKPILPIDELKPHLQ